MVLLLNFRPLSLSVSLSPPGRPPSNPLPQVVAQRLMVQGAGNVAVATTATSYRPTHTAATIARSILKTDGIRGFFRGYSVSLLTDAPSSGIFWML